MSDNAVPEDVQPETTAEISPDVQAIIDAKLAAEREKYDAQLRGLNRANSKLKSELDEKAMAGKTIEERMAMLESERAAEKRRADTMSAFSKRGLSEDWRSLFDLSDPEERADALRDLLEAEKKAVQKSTATQFMRDPEAEPAAGGKRMYTVEELRGMTPQEINKLWTEKRIKSA